MEAIHDDSDIQNLIYRSKQEGIKHINYINPVDNWLQKRIQNFCKENDITTTVFDSPLFLNTKEDLSVIFRKDKKKISSNYFLHRTVKKTKYSFGS